MVPVQSTAGRLPRIAGSILLVQRLTPVALVAIAPRLARLPPSPSLSPLPLLLRSEIILTPPVAVRPLGLALLLAMASPRPNPMVEGAFPLLLNPRLLLRAVTNRAELPATLLHLSWPNLPVRLVGQARSLPRQATLESTVPKTQAGAPLAPLNRVIQLFALRLMFRIIRCRLPALLPPIMEIAALLTPMVLPIGQALREFGVAWNRVMSPIIRSLFPRLLRLFRIILPSRVILQPVRLLAAPWPSLRPLFPIRALLVAVPRFFMEMAARPFVRPFILPSRVRPIVLALLDLVVILATRWARASLPFMVIVPVSEIYAVDARAALRFASRYSLVG